jgi:hypothetical protein
MLRRAGSKLPLLGAWANCGLLTPDSVGTNSHGRRVAMKKRVSKKKTPKPIDLMNVIDPNGVDLDLDQLLDRGKTARVRILIGTENPNRLGEIPEAHTRVSITFSNEKDLRQCAKMLQWSDERLRALPEQLLRWSWDRTFREGMTISFGVNWYDLEFFKQRRDAFLEPEHAAFYKSFNASPRDFKVEHFVKGDPGFEQEVEHHRLP